MQRTPAACDGDNLILYCAGNMAPELLAAMAARTKATNWLETFAHKGSRDCAEHFTSFECMEEQFRVFVDSGAFTHWCEGKEVDQAYHDAYIAYAKKLLSRAIFPDRIVFASLDVIPGTLKGPYPTEREFRDAATRGWAKYQREKSAGLKTIPTFHQGDPWEFLDRMVDDADYIGLSPRKVDTTRQRRWSGSIRSSSRIKAMGRLPHEGNMHKAIKTHGLGVASPVLMETYPWYSVDSRRWLQAGNGYYFYFDGRRIQMAHASEWGRLRFHKYAAGANEGHSFSAIHHYRPPHEAERVYYYHEKAMRADAELNGYMTEHWAYAG